MVSRKYTDDEIAELLAEAPDFPGLRLDRLLGPDATGEDFSAALEIWRLRVTMRIAMDLEV